MNMKRKEYFFLSWVTHSISINTVGYPWVEELIYFIAWFNGVINHLLKEQNFEAEVALIRALPTTE